MSKQLVYDFPKVSAEEWMDVVRKDLKSTNYDQLKWIIDDDILLEPIVTAPLEGHRWQHISCSPSPGSALQFWVLYPDLGSAVRHLA